MGRLLNFFAKKYSHHERELFDFLRAGKLFTELTSDELVRFLPFLHEREYAQNEVVFFRNDPSQALYIIRHGEIRLTIDVQDNFEELITIDQKMSFGDDALLPKSSRNYNAICASESASLYVIPQINIFDIFEEDPRIQAKIMTAFARYYDNYLSAIFKVYRESFGFFDLGQAYIQAQKQTSRRNN